MPQSNKKTIEKLIGISREIGLYSEEPSKNISPIEYWKQNSSVYPGLFFCDKRILCFKEVLFHRSNYFRILVIVFGIEEKCVCDSSKTYRRGNCT